MPELILFFAFVTTILWLIIGYRAMRAHERIADSAARFVILKTPDRSAEIRSSKVTQNRLYKEFLSEDEERAKMPAKERHDAFRDWLDSLA